MSVDENEEKATTIPMPAVSDNDTPNDPMSTDQVQQKSITIPMPVVSDIDPLSSFYDQSDLQFASSNASVTPPVVPIGPPNADPQLLNGLDSQFADLTFEDFNANVQQAQLADVPKEQLRKIIINPEIWDFEGTTQQAQALRAHVDLAHICWRCLRQVCENVIGLEHLAKIPFHISLPPCHCCRICLSKAAGPPKKIHQ